MYGELSERSGLSATGIVAALNGAKAKGASSRLTAKEPITACPPLKEHRKSLKEAEENHEPNWLPPGVATLPGWSSLPRLSRCARSGLKRFGGSCYCCEDGGTSELVRIPHSSGRNSNCKITLATPHGFCNKALIRMIAQTADFVGMGGALG